MFFIYAFTFEVLKIFLWIYCYSHHARIVNVSYAKIAKIFFQIFIPSRVVFPEFARCVKSVQNFIFNYHFKKNVSECGIGQVTFCFANENKRYKDAVCLLKRNRDIPAHSSICCKFPSSICLKIRQNSPEIILQISAFFHWRI